MRFVFLFRARTEAASHLVFLGRVTRSHCLFLVIEASKTIRMKKLRGLRGGLSLLSSPFKEITCEKPPRSPAFISATLSYRAAILLYEFVLFAFLQNVTVTSTPFSSQMLFSSETELLYSLEDAFLEEYPSCDCAAPSWRCWLVRLLQIRHRTPFRLENLALLRVPFCQHSHPVLDRFSGPISQLVAAIRHLRSPEFNLYHLEPKCLNLEFSLPPRFPHSFPRLSFCQLQEMPAPDSRHPLHCYSLSQKSLADLRDMLEIAIRTFKRLSEADRQRRCRCSSFHSTFWFNLAIQHTRPYPAQMPYLLAIPVHLYLAFPKLFASDDVLSNIINLKLPAYHRWRVLLALAEHFN